MLKSLVVVILVAYLLPKFLHWYYSISTENFLDEYDFIIVGGGTAGCVVANRLSEIEDNKVLLLEAGGEYLFSLLASVPAFTSLMQNGEADWHYVTESQEHAMRHLVDRKSFWPRGKILGGTSLLNALVYTRGSKHDFDEWEHLGATGWSYKDVFPYFKKSERVLAEELKNSNVHGHDGYLNVDTRKHFQLNEWFLQAGRDLGYKTIDYNEEDKGFSHIQLTVDSKGRRSNAANSFLYPFAFQRKNLHIVTNAHVTKILSQTNANSMPQITGVEFVKNGVIHEVKSKKEVVLSAGAIGTPQILMLSGIGPKDHLNEHKINVIADLPGVGSNLKDHPIIDVGFTFPSITKPLFKPSDFLSLKEIVSYLYDGSGIYSTPNQVNGFAYLKFDDENTKNKRFNPPDVHILASVAAFSDVSWQAVKDMYIHLFNVKQDEVDELVERAEEIGRERLTDFTLLTALSRPKSVGSIQLKSNNYSEHPLIDPQYMSDERDVKTLVKALRFFEQMEQTETFKSRGFKVEFASRVCPGGKRSIRSDEFLECLVRNRVFTEYHPCCTAKMGSDKDPMAVTDHRLRVYKVKGLRVADASVMPDITSGNIQAPCYMIGEKASDMIKEDWNLKRQKQDFT